MDRHGGGPHQMDTLQFEIDLINQYQSTYNIGNVLTFKGSAIAFCTQFQQPTINLSKVTEFHFTISGQQTQIKNQCCYLTTFIFACLIFPIFFICCQWWKDFVHPKFQMNLKAYQILARLIQSCPTLRFVTLTVADNNLSKQKLDTLALNLSGSTVTRFQLNNMALQSNCHENQFSDFEQNCLLIKNLRLKSNQIKWGNTIIKTQQVYDDLPQTNKALYKQNNF